MMPSGDIASHSPLFAHWVDLQTKTKVHWAEQKTFCRLRVVNWPHSPQYAHFSRTFALGTAERRGRRTKKQNKQRNKSCQQEKGPQINTVKAYNIIGYEAKTLFKISTNKGVN